MTWNPAQYLKFAGARLRPAVDLLARIPIEAPASIYDLGCGAGQTTSLLASRFTGADITGVDSSDEMLESARGVFPELKFVAGDIKKFRAVPPTHLIFSNAALHWVPDHAHLVPRLMDSIKTGGVLAVQMPHVDDSPRIRALHEIAKDPRWRERTQPLLFPGPLAAEAYYDMLTPLSETVDIWETEYLHALEGKDPVVEWSKGSGAAPLLDALDVDERADFLKRYAKAMREAYSKRPDGRTLLPFRRMFIIAVKK